MQTMTNDPVVVRVVENLTTINKSAVDLIVTENNFNEWSENLFAIKKAIKQVNDKRMDFTRPLEEAKKKLIAEARGVTDPMEATVELVEAALLVYQLEVQRKAEEHERFLVQQELERLEKEKEELVEQAVDNESDYALDEAEVVEQQIEEVKHVSTEVSATKRTNFVTTSISKKWAFELLDFSKVPDEYKMLNEVKIRKMISGEYGTHEIAGLNIYQKASLSSRRR